MFDKIEGLKDEIKLVYGDLKITIYRKDMRDRSVEVFYKDTRLADRSTLVEALEYAYVGVRLCNPHFSDWCYGADREFLLAHLMDAMLMIHKPAPRVSEDNRLGTTAGIHRTIQLRTEDGYLHPKEEDIRITVHRCICGDNYSVDTIKTTVTMSDDDITVTKQFFESSGGKMRDLDAFARKLYARHFE